MNNIIIAEYTEEQINEITSIVKYARIIEEERSIYSWKYYRIPGTERKETNLLIKIDDIFFIEIENIQVLIDNSTETEIETENVCNLINNFDLSKNMLQNLFECCKDTSCYIDKTSEEPPRWDIEFTDFIEQNLKIYGEDFCSFKDISEDKEIEKKLLEYIKKHNESILSIGEDDIFYCDLEASFHLEIPDNLEIVQIYLEDESSYLYYLFLSPQEFKDMRFMRNKILDIKNNMEDILLGAIKHASYLKSNPKIASIIKDRILSVKNYDSFLNTILKDFKPFKITYWDMIYRFTDKDIESLNRYFTGISADSDRIKEEILNKDYKFYPIGFESNNLPDVSDIELVNLKDDRNSYIVYKKINEAIIDNLIKYDEYDDTNNKDFEEAVEKITVIYNHITKKKELEKVVSKESTDEESKRIYQYLRKIINEYRICIGSEYDFCNNVFMSYKDLNKPMKIHKILNRDIALNNIENIKALCMNIAEYNNGDDKYFSKIESVCNELFTWNHYVYCMTHDETKKSSIFVRLKDKDFVEINNLQESISDIYNIKDIEKVQYELEAIKEMIDNLSDITDNAVLKKEEKPEEVIELEDSYRIQKVKIIHSENFYIVEKGIKPKKFIELKDFDNIQIMICGKAFCTIKDIKDRSISELMTCVNNRYIRYCYKIPYFSDFNDKIDEILIYLREKYYVKIEIPLSLGGSKWSIKKSILFIKQMLNELKKILKGIGLESLEKEAGFFLQSPLELDDFRQKKIKIWNEEFISIGDFMVCNGKDVFNMFVKKYTWYYYVIPNRIGGVALSSIFVSIKEKYFVLIGLPLDLHGDLVNTKEIILKMKEEINILKRICNEEEIVKFEKNTGVLPNSISLDTLESYMIKVSDLDFCSIKSIISDSNIQQTIENYFRKNFNTWYYCSIDDTNISMNSKKILINIREKYYIEIDFLSSLSGEFDSVKKDIKRIKNTYEDLIKASIEDSKLAEYEFEEKIGNLPNNIKNLEEFKNDKIEVFGKGFISIKEIIENSDTDMEEILNKHYRSKVKKELVEPMDFPY